MKLSSENTGQTKSARAFLLSSPMENEKFSFSIWLDNQKALALFGCPVFSGHHFSFSGLTFWNEARSQYPTKFNKVNLLCRKSTEIF
jgi:hypothetical protein